MRDLRTNKPYMVWNGTDIKTDGKGKEKLLYCCKNAGMTQYEAVMQGIDKVDNEIRATDALDK